MKKLLLKEQPPLPPLVRGVKKGDARRRAEGVLLFLAPLTRGGRGVGFQAGRGFSSALKCGLFQQPQCGSDCAARREAFDSPRPSIRGFAATQGEGVSGNGEACPERSRGAATQGEERSFGGLRGRRPGFFNSPLKRGLIRFQKDFQAFSRARDLDARLHLGERQAVGEDVVNRQVRSQEHVHRRFELHLGIGP